MTQDLNLQSPFIDSYHTLQWDREKIKSKEVGSFFPSIRF
jgi:hypothetical protein